MTEATALTVHENRQPVPLNTGGKIAAVIPQDVEQAWRMAGMINKSGLAPRDMQEPEKIVAAIFAGMEVGLPPMQAVQSIAVVNGRPTIWGDAALGLVMASGLCEDFEEHVEGEGDAMVAVCTARRVGMSSPSVQRFSVEDAKAASLWGKTGPWKQYPKRMLAMRARAFALRNLFPDVLKGLGVREEVRDFSGPPVERHARPEPTGTAAALAHQAGAVDEEPVEVEAETITDEDEDAGLTPDSTDYWIAAFDQALTKRAVEQTFARWMQDHYNDFSVDDRKAVTRAKNQKIWTLDASEAAE